MLDAIFSSKMFLASKNKNKITTAINDPLNGELVQQLRSYLDDDFLDEAVEYRKSVEVSDAEETKSSEPEESPESNTSRTSHEAPGSSPSPAPNHTSTENLNNLSEEGLPDANDPIADETTETSDDSDSTVEESEKVKTASITPDLMSILNSSDSTKGVRRVNSSIDSELWIYYDDSVNLNNVMEPVISSVYTCCPNVQFSRLARTYNAVVFSV